MEEDTLRRLRWRFLGRIVGGVAHYHANELVLMTLYAERIIGHPEDRNAVRESARRIVMAATSSNKLVRRLLRLAAPTVVVEPIAEAVELRSWISDLFELIASSLPDLLLEVAESAPRLHMAIDPSILDDLLVAVIDCALKLAGEDGRLSVDWRESPSEASFEAGHVAIMVTLAAAGTSDATSPDVRASLAILERITTRAGGSFESGVARAAASLVLEIVLPLRAASSS
jgi:hypothetical protein